MNFKIWNSSFSSQLSFFSKPSPASFLLHYPLLSRTNNPHKSQSNDSFLDRLKNLLQRIPLARQSIPLLALSKLQQSAHPIRIFYILQQILRACFPPSLLPVRNAE